MLNILCLFGELNKFNNLNRGWFIRIIVLEGHIIVLGGALIYEYPF